MFYLFYLNCSKETSEILKDLLFLPSSKQISVIYLDCFQITFVEKVKILQTPKQTQQFVFKNILSIIKSLR